MRVSYTKNFMKQAGLLQPNAKKKLIERISLFQESPTHETLRNHQLKGAYKEYRSINITGDIRALYLVRDDEYVFDQLGTHSQLYG